MDNILANNPTGSASRGGLRMIWLLLLLVLGLSLTLVIVPVFLIQPFRPQTQRALEVSYLMRNWSPVVTLVLLIATFALVIWKWGHARRWWRKTFLVIILSLAIVPAWFARQNHFEWMFNPLRNSTYVKANDASFVRDADMVLAVKINNEAVAYPVRLMAYHHVVSDVVGGTPICATY